MLKQRDDAVAYVHVTSREPRFQSQIQRGRRSVRSFREANVRIATMKGQITRLKTSEELLRNKLASIESCHRVELDAAVEEMSKSHNLKGSKQQGLGQV